MKKVVALLLALVMLIPLGACDFTGSNSGTGDNSSEQQSVTQPVKKKLSRGTIQGDVYTSDFLDIQFTKPQSWVYSTEEEIASVMNMGADFLGADYEQLLESNMSVYDMMVVDSLTGTSMNICIENLAKTMAANITVEQYKEALKQQLDATGMGFKMDDQSKTVKLSGQDYLRVRCALSMSGVDMEQFYYLRKIDNYMCSVIVTIVSGYEMSDIEAMFK